MASKNLGSTKGSLKKLEDKISDGVYEAASNAVQKALENVPAENLSVEVKKVSIKNPEKIKKMVEQEAQTSINSKAEVETDLEYKPKTIKNVDLSKYIKLDGEKLKEEIKKLYKEILDSPYDSKLGKKLTGALRVADFKDIKFDKNELKSLDQLQAYKEYFYDEYSKLIKEIDEELSKAGLSSLEGKDSTKEIVKQQDIAKQEIKETGNVAEATGDKIVESHNKATEAAKEQIAVEKELVETQKELQTQPARDSIEEITKESSELLEVQSSASSAAESKREFAEVNKDVLQSIISSLSGLDGEGEAFKNISKILKTLTNAENVDKIAESLNKIRNELNQEVSQNGLIKALQDLVNTGVDLKSLASVLENVTKKNAKALDKVSTSGTSDNKAAKKSFDQELAVRKKILDLEKEIALAKARGDEKANEIKAKNDPLITALTAEADKIKEVRTEQGISDDALEKSLKEQIELIQKRNDALAEGTRAATEIQTRSDVHSGIAGYLKDLEKLSSSSKSSKEFKAQIGGVISELKQLDDTVDTLDLTELKSRFKEAGESFQSIVDAKSLEKSKAVAERNIEALGAKIAKFGNKNTAMSSRFKKELDELRERLQSVNNKVDFNQIIKEFNQLEAAVNDAGQTGLSTWDKFTKRLTSMSMSALAKYFSFYDIIRYTRQAVQTIQQLDTALVDLRKTTTMTGKELDQFYYDANEVAKQLGVTTEEIINQAAAWSRLGYSSKEAATEMSRISSQFAQISPGMSVEDSTDALVSTMKAFHIEVDDAERDILDNVNRIGNTFATSNQEIGEMLMRSSAAMNAANNSLEETIALESAAVQITRNAETTGTAFRTISMRIRGLDEETEEALEDFDLLQGKLADLTKTAEHPGGISLFTDATKTEYKSTYQLLKDISSIWDELTDKQQAGVLETIAGKRGGQVLAGVLEPENFKEVERALQEMQNAAGSADQEMSIIEEKQYSLNVQQCA